jgi:hypothetical protein
MVVGRSDSEIASEAAERTRSGGVCWAVVVDSGVDGGAEEAEPQENQEEEEEEEDGLVGEATGAGA